MKCQNRYLQEKDSRETGRDDIKADKWREMIKKLKVTNEITLEITQRRTETAEIS